MTPTNRETLDSLPPHMLRAWYEWQEVELQADPLWHLLDKCATVLLTAGKSTLSGQCEAMAEKIADGKDDASFEAFLREHQGWDKDEETVNMTRGI